jgi:hypothetical protein
MSFETVFSCIQKHLKYGDFYKCTFFTWDGKKKQIVLRTSKKDRILVFISIVVHWIYLLAQLVAFKKAPRTSLSETVETIGISLIVFIIFVLRFDPHIDYLHTQLLNYIFGFKVESL